MVLALVMLGTLAMLLVMPLAAQAAGRYRLVRACSAPRPGAAACLAMRLEASSLTRIDLRERAAAQAREARPQVAEKSPVPGYLTPQSLYAAYGLPNEAPASSLQTIAVVDAYDDPTAEADLGVYDRQFALPPCTAANGCFRKLDQQGNPSPLPPKQGGWDVEISLDVEMAHAICPGCRVLLVEADSEEFKDLGTAVNAAVAAGATEISNSYAGPEEAGYITQDAGYYDHPGVVLTVASGDYGYLNDDRSFEAGTMNFPADSPDVVAVGGTELTESGESWTSTAWDEGGSGCSDLFTAPPWQSEVADIAATGCAGERSIADVAAIGDPETGVDVYDSTPNGEGYPTGWGVWGGTSVASPIVAAEFALAGGSRGVAYPAATLYSHLGDGEDLYDVVSGSNGTCGGDSSCNAEVGYDGPTGLGSPIGLGAFSTAGTPVDEVRPSVAGIAEAGQTLTLTQGEWSNSPTTTTDQWELCNADGDACAAIPGATGSTYAIAASDLGSSIRVEESAANSLGNGSSSDSIATATISTDVPAITAVAPLAGITGSTVTITGSALNGADAVRFGTLAASFEVVSPSEIEATVPDGGRPGKITVTTPNGTATSTARFTPTLSLTGLTPRQAAPGRIVTITGVGFDESSGVAFDGVPAAAVTFVSASRLKATIPSGASSGPVTVTNVAAPVGTVAAAAPFTVT